MMSVQTTVHYNTVSKIQTGATDAASHASLPDTLIACLVGLLGQGLFL